MWVGGVQQMQDSTAQQMNEELLVTDICSWFCRPVFSALYYEGCVIQLMTFQACQSEYIPFILLGLSDRYIECLMQLHEISF